MEPGGPRPSTHCILHPELIHGDHCVAKKYFPAPARTGENRCAETCLLNCEKYNSVLSASHGCDRCSSPTRHRNLGVASLLLQRGGTGHKAWGPVVLPHREPMRSLSPRPPGCWPSPSWARAGCAGGSSRPRPFPADGLVSSRRYRWVPDLVQLLWAHPLPGPWPESLCLGTAMSHGAGVHVLAMGLVQPGGGGTQEPLPSTPMGQRCQRMAVESS